MAAIDMTMAAPSGILYWIGWANGMVAALFDALDNIDRIKREGFDNEGDSEIEEKCNDE